MVDWVAVVGTTAVVKDCKSAATAGAGPALLGRAGGAGSSMIGGRVGPAAAATAGAKAGAEAVTEAAELGPCAFLMCDSIESLRPNTLGHIGH